MSGIVGYNIYVDGVLYNTTPIRAYRHTVEGLENGVEYEFEVKSVNEFGEESDDSIITRQTPQGDKLTVSLVENRVNQRSYDINIGRSNIRDFQFSSDGFKIIALSGNYNIISIDLLLLDTIH